MLLFRTISYVCVDDSAAAAGAGARASAAAAAVAAADSAAKLNLHVTLGDVEASVQQIDDTLFKTLRVSVAGVVVPW
jgi:hypothetical protein